MLITKAQAQEILGGSERKIERLVKSGKLPVAQYQKGARKPTPYFDQAQVEALKDDAPNLNFTSLIENDTETVKASDRQNDTDFSRALVKTPLAIFPNQALEIPELQTRLVEALEAIAAQNDKPQTVKPTLALTELSAKLLLTLSECTALTGLSRTILKAAIDKGDLKASQIGRAYRIKRVDLDAYLKSL